MFVVRKRLSLHLGEAEEREQFVTAFPQARYHARAALTPTSARRPCKLCGPQTVAELSHELDIAPSVIRNWARRSEAAATTAVAANDDLVARILTPLASCVKSQQGVTQA